MPCKWACCLLTTVQTAEESPAPVLGWETEAQPESGTCLKCLLGGGGAMSAQMAVLPTPVTRGRGSSAYAVWRVSPPPRCPPSKAPELGGRE